MENKFTPGDVVQLKSGGDPMTLVEYTDQQPPKVRCVYRADTGVQYVPLPEACLCHAREGSLRRASEVDVSIVN